MGNGRYREARSAKMAERRAPVTFDPVVLFAALRDDTAHRDRERVRIGREMLRAEMAILADIDHGRDR